MPTMKLRVPHNGPRAGFLEVDIVDRLDFIWPDGCDDPDDEEDLESFKGYTLLKQGWDRTAHTLTVPSDPASVDLMATAITGALNCIDDEIEHAEDWPELVKINKGLRRAGESLLEAILKHREGE